MDIFVSYSHRDERWKSLVCLYLQCLRQQKLLDFHAWDDSEIGVSEDWHHRIREAIDSARIALLLVSPDFMISDFIQNKELPRIRERREASELVVVPTIIRPCPWEVDPWLSPIQAHPAGGTPLSTLSEPRQEEAIKDLAMEISRLLSADATIAEDEEDTPETPEAPTITSTERGSEARFDFMGEPEVRDFVARHANAPCTGILNIHRVKTQRVWLATTPGEILCLIDSEATRARNREVQWHQPLVPEPQVTAREKSRVKTAGTVDIGSRQNWLYSKRLFDTPEQIVAAIQGLIHSG